MNDKQEKLKSINQDLQNAQDMMDEALKSADRAFYDDPKTICNALYNAIDKVSSAVEYVCDAVRTLQEVEEGKTEE